MIVHNVTQGSDEWRRMRLGIPTASSFDRIVTSTGKQSKQRYAYMRQLMAERITGELATSYQSPAMLHGVSYEDEAASFYARRHERLEVRRVGFVTNEDGTIGCSPDRMVGDVGLVEIKCPQAATHIGYLLDMDSFVESDYRVQIQGQLWLTEREWCDVYSYHPKIKPICVRVSRDQKYINLLAGMLTNFVEEMQAKLLQLDSAATP